MEASVQALHDRVTQAAANGTALRIVGGGTKDWYGQEPAGETLDVRGHAGVIDYDPTELVVTVRCGTPLAELETLLEGQGQMLAFEPPHFGAAATVGGMVAAGLSGPRRAAVGAVRDFVLGTTLLDGRGQVLQFGGRVMKNVAGYDVSRLLAGSLGALGVLLDVSLKVLPKPVAERTLMLEMNQADALRALNAWGGQPLPISASLWQQGRLWLRLSGASAAVGSAVARIGGEALEDARASQLWQDVREQRLPFFTEGSAALWRLSVPSVAPVLELPQEPLIEWGGALRWIRADVPSDDVPADHVRKAAAAVGGHATLFRGGEKRIGCFHPLAPVLQTVNRNLKLGFDPQRIFNPGRSRAFD